MGGSVRAADAGGARPRVAGAWLGAAIDESAAPPLGAAIDESTPDLAAAAPAAHPRDRCRAAGFPPTFDALIRRAWLKHGGGEWAQYHCGWRAQIAAESSMRPEARSRAGAEGLAQTMASAATDCRRAGLIGARPDPKFSVFCGAWIMRRNGNIWSAPRPERDRLILARLSYISGAGSGIRAQRLARADGRTARGWTDGIGEFLDRAIAPANAAAARHYIDRIAGLERRMTP